MSEAFPDRIRGLKILIAKERQAGEHRVAGSPESVRKLVSMNFDVAVEAGAGAAAHFRDEDYAAAGARVVADDGLYWSQADLVLKVQPVQFFEVDRLKAGAVLIGFIWPARHPELLQHLAKQQVSALAMDCVPRISRAQKLDALSSMANIAGYRAVVEAAQHFGSFFTGQITAAGKIPPAKVLVIGAGVAGLAAIGTAKSLGAVVRAFDTRPEVRDQVKSMGAEFLEVELDEDGSGEGGYAKVMSEAFIRAEMELFAQQAKDVDIIITTALIPGRRAPVLITEAMLQVMKEGSVVVDLAAENGGNCELTKPGEVVRKHGVTLIGYTDLASRLPTQASNLYANNIVHLLRDMTKDGAFKIDLGDDVVRGTLVSHAGEVTWPPPKPAGAPPTTTSGKSATVAASPAKREPSHAAHSKRSRSGKMASLALGALALGLFGLGQVATSEFMSHLTVFVLACFIGWQVVWNVTPALHTPLMSVTNAISGIILIGAMLQIDGDLGNMSTILAAIAVLIATINVAGGFLVTQRMLSMFRK